MKHEIPLPSSVVSASNTIFSCAYPVHSLVSSLIQSKHKCVASVRNQSVRDSYSGYLCSSMDSFISYSTRSVLCTYSYSTQPIHT